MISRRSFVEKSLPVIITVAFFTPVIIITGGTLLQCCVVAGAATCARILSLV